MSNAHDLSRNSSEKSLHLNQFNQFSTFLVSGRLYGIDVTKVQEVVKPLPMTKIPLAPNYVHGLINLRGQVVTAIGLHELFKLKEPSHPESMNVICKIDGIFFSLLVDEIGDVVEVNKADFEDTPSTIPEDLRQFMTGVYKVGNSLLSILDIDKLGFVINDNHNS